MSCPGGRNCFCLTEWINCRTMSTRHRRSLDTARLKDIILENWSRQTLIQSLATRITEAITASTVSTKGLSTYHEQQKQIFITRDANFILLELMLCPSQGRRTALRVLRVSWVTCSHDMMRSLGIGLLLKKKLSVIATSIKMHSC
jgi:hypothetical protein